jgi:hypothetical protein
MQTTDLAPETIHASSEDFEVESPPSDGTFSGDELPNGVTDGADDGLGSPIRQYVPRGRPKPKSKPKSKPKQEPKTKAKKPMEAAKENGIKRRKAAADKKTKLELVSEEEEPKAATLSADTFWEPEDRPFAINCRQSNIQPSGSMPLSAPKEQKVKTRPPSASNSALRGTKRARELQELGAALGLTGDFVSIMQARAVDSDLFETDLVPEEVAQLFEMADSPQPTLTARPIVKAVRPSSGQSGRGRSDREVKSSSFPAEDEALKADLAGFYNVPFSVWQQQSSGTHTRYTLPAQHMEPENGVRRSVYAVLGDIIDNGRMCSGYKSDRSGWRRENGPKINYYLRDGSFVPKKAAPAAR